MLDDQTLKDIMAELSFWDSPPILGLFGDINLPDRLNKDLAVLQSS